MLLTRCSARCAGTCAEVGLVACRPSHRRGDPLGVAVVGRADMVVRRSIAFVAVLVSLVVGVAFAAAPAGAATTLPSGFGAIVVDPATGTVFVSSPTASVVTVLDPEGAVV